MTPCDKCGSTTITYYRQRRKDGNWIITARCENNHHPVTGKPFYPLSQFKVYELPLLPGQEDNQSVLFPVEKKTPREHTPQTLIDMVEAKRRGSEMFPFLKKG